MVVYHTESGLGLQVTSRRGSQTGQTHGAEKRSVCTWALERSRPPLGPQSGRSRQWHRVDQNGSGTRCRTTECVVGTVPVDGRDGAVL